MSDTEFTHMSEPLPARRIEIFTGAGRRRSWPASVKAEIVAESEREGETVCAVARRHGLTPQQLFAWRREARRRRVAAAEPMSAPALAFVPVVSDAGVPAATPQKTRGRPRSAPGSRVAARRIAVEIEIDGAVVRVRHGADARTVGAVLEALKLAR
jgi:transposase